MVKHIRHTAMGERVLVAYPLDFDLSAGNHPAVGNEWKSPTLNFDPDTNEYAYTDLRFIDRIPGSWIKPVKLWFFPDAIPDGSQGTRTVWRMIVHAMRVGDYLPTNVGASPTFEGVSPPVLGSDFATEVDFTSNLDVVLRGNLHDLVDSPHGNGRPNLQIELWRVADDGRDTMPGDAKFLKLMFSYIARH